MEKPKMIIEEGARYYYDEEGDCYKKEPCIREYKVNYSEEENTAFEHWFSNQVFTDEYTTKDIQESYMAGYNDKQREMERIGLALQSDMDKTIEQNMELKKQIAKLRQKFKRWTRLSPDEKTCYYLLFQVKHGVCLKECLENLGYFSKTRYNTPMKFDKEMCRDCNGKGKILASTCKHCNGTGYVTIQLTEQLFYCSYCGAPLNGNSVCAKCGCKNN